jgi:hypothetical protein
MAYQKPTLFGVAYASRLFREVDEAQAYEKLCDETRPELNLQYPDNNGHAQALLKWLNRWGCRIPKNSPDALFKNWEKWYKHSRLPGANVKLVYATECDLDVLADAYSALLQIRGLGPTGASKLLFAIRPQTAMAWDAAIQTEFELAGDREGYRAMLARSKDEAENVVDDAARCGVADWRSIPHEVGRSGHTLPKLLDEYHWVTITRRHNLPCCEKLQQWMGWACREVN